MLRVFSVRQQSQLFSITLKHVSRELCCDNILFPTGLQSYQLCICARYPRWSAFPSLFVVTRSITSSCSAVRLIAIILYKGYNTLKQGLFLIKAVTALLRESHTLNKAVTAVFTSKAAARYKAVIVLRHTTALLRDPYCNNTQQNKNTKHEIFKVG